MTILHQVQDSPSTGNALELALRYATDADSIILCGNGVNAVLSHKALLCTAKADIILLNDDVVARGLEEYTHSFELIDYQQFVGLTISHKKVVTW